MTRVLLLFLGAASVAVLACAGCARDDLGWTPSVSLDEGLARTIEWIGHNLGAYRPMTYTI